MSNKPPPLPTAIPTALPVAKAVPATKAVAAAPSAGRFEQAAQILERAASSGAQSSEVLYMLALAYKRQGKNAEARKALDRISKPDGNVLLQKALLAISENNLQQAEQDLERGWAIDSSSYEICYNLLLVRLTGNKLDACLQLVPRALELLETRGTAATGEATRDEKWQSEKRFMQVLGALLTACKRPEGRTDAGLADITPADEQRLLKVIRSLGQLDTVHNLLKMLSRARPGSAALREAYVEAVLVKGKELIDKCLWTDAELLLRPLARERGLGRTSQIALCTLLGVCSTVTQDYEGAISSFQAALKHSPNDPRLHQNIALAHEFNGRLNQAEPHWARFFELISDAVPAPKDLPRYRESLAYESLSRLASRYAETEKWAQAINFLQRAAIYRPNDPETLERLFHLYQNAKRGSDARRTIEQLRKIKPGEPQYELFELDLIEVKGLNDIEKLLTEIDRIRRRHPDDARVEERAVNMVGNVIPLMGNLCDQLTDQMNRVTGQIRTLPNYQINWTAVHEVMRDLMKELQKLRRIVGKCLPLVTSDEHRRIVRDLADHIDRKMEECRQIGV